jgi:hypothetical protein
MAEQTLIRNFRDGTIVGKDGAGAPLSHTFSYDPGDVKITGLGYDLYEIVKYLVRGELASVRKANRRFPGLSWTFYQTDWTEGPIPIFMRSGAWVAATSTLGANADVWSFLVEFTIEGTNFGEADQKLTFDDCVGSFDFAEGDPNAYTCTCEVLGTITIADV